MKSLARIRSPFLSTIIFTVALAVLTSCGGGGGGDTGSGGGGGNSTTTISGKALAPSGVVVQLSNQTFWYALNDFLFPSAGAAITGLDPVVGAKVELIEVNDAGVQVGPVLATASTSITGDYELSLPAGVNLKANLVVRITGTSVDLRAMVVETTVDITPLSEFILQKFIISGTPLSTLAVSDVVKLSGYAKEFDVAATADLSSMITALENQIGSFVDNSIAAITAKPGVASAIAGDYFHNTFNIGFTYTNDDVYNAHESYLSIRAGTGAATLTDEGGNGFGAVTGPEHNITAGGGIRNTVQLIGYEDSVYQGGDTLVNLGTVDSKGNLNLTFPFNEDFTAGTNHGYRQPPTSQLLYATNVDGLRFGTGVNPSATYRAIDTNGDGVTDAIDPSAYVGHGFNFTFDIVAPQGSGMMQSDMAGDYGVVFIQQFFQPNGLSGIVTASYDSSIDVSGNSTDTGFDGTVIGRAPSTTTPGMVDFTETAVLPLGSSIQTTVQSNGQLTQTSNGSTAVQYGFVSNNREFAVLNISDSTGTAPDWMYVSNGQALIVRKPVSAPDLSGRSYRLMSIEKQMDDDSIIRIQRIRGDNDFLNFSANGSQVSITYQGRDVIKRISDDSDFTMETTTDGGTVNLTNLSIGNDGKISFTQTDVTSGFVRNWIGYISASSNIIILSSVERANDGTSYSLGTYIATPVL